MDPPIWSDTIAKMVRSIDASNDTNLFIHCDATQMFNLTSYSSDVEGLGVLINTLAPVVITSLIVSCITFLGREEKKNPIDAKMQETLHPVTQWLHHLSEKARRRIFSLIGREPNPEPNDCENGRLYETCIKSLRTMSAVQNIFAFATSLAFFITSDHLTHLQLQIIVYITLANYITTAAGLAYLARRKDIQRIEHILRYCGLGGLTVLQIAVIFEATINSLGQRNSIPDFCRYLYHYYALSVPDAVFWAALIGLLYVFLIISNTSMAASVRGGLYSFFKNKKHENRRSLSEKTRSGKWYWRVLGKLGLRFLDVAETFLHILTSKSVLTMLLVMMCIWLTVRVTSLRRKDYSLGLGQIVSALTFAGTACGLIWIVLSGFLAVPATASIPSASATAEAQSIQQTSVTLPPEADRATTIPAVQQSRDVPAPSVLEAGGLPAQNFFVYEENRKATSKSRWFPGLIAVVAVDSICFIAALSWNSSRFQDSEIGRSQVLATIDPSVFNPGYIAAEKLLVITAYVLLADVLEYLFRGTFWDRLSHTQHHRTRILIQAALCMIVLIPGFLSTASATIHHLDSKVAWYAFGGVFGLWGTLWIIGGVLAYYGCIKKEAEVPTEGEMIEMLERVRVTTGDEGQMTENSGSHSASNQMPLQLPPGWGEVGTFAKDCESGLQSVRSGSDT